MTSTHHLSIFDDDDDDDDDDNSNNMAINQIF